MGSHADGDGCTRPDDEHLMRAGYALDGDDGCIADARHHAVALLDEARTDHHLPVSERARDLTQLVVSELVTNALKYAPGPVLMELRIDAHAVDVVVWDSDPSVPAALAADPDRIGQHGLEIVKAVTEDLFTEQEPVGKRVTARIALSDAPSSDTVRRCTEESCGTAVRRDQA
ncbi:ATP-binding protein [Streptomyces sp. ADMS]|uniref:ATP-binding protein n=1 Tax=Streptomyces sp. ADMS TaxID=3071415 RepID=UPI00296EDD4B|nr:ATP-binding protein [Streptomyces sp. ADMS]MDW4907307.1 ATP-binding protein [Streptomyces sp. ADMS]